MKTRISILCLVFLIHFGASAQTAFELDPRQSMLMTGKGPGQDGTINPYDGQDCIAIVENIGKRPFSIRIQNDGKIVEEITIAKKEVKRIELLKGYELYLDPNPNGIAKARVSYEKEED